MKKSTKKVASIKITIGRFNEPVKNLEVEKDSVISNVLEAAEISLNDNESIWVNGDEAFQQDIIEDGDYLIIVGKKAGGNEEEAEEGEECKRSFTINSSIAREGGAGTGATKRVHSLFLFWKRRSPFLSRSAVFTKAS